LDGWKERREGERCGLSCSISRPEDKGRSGQVVRSGRYWDGREAIEGGVAILLVRK
jgi:hypothetical protein